MNPSERFANISQYIAKHKADMGKDTRDAMGVPELELQIASGMAWIVFVNEGCWSPARDELRTICDPLWGEREIESIGKRSAARVPLTEHLNEKLIEEFVQVFQQSLAVESHKIGDQTG